MTHDDMPVDKRKQPNPTKIKTVISKQYIEKNANNDNLLNKRLDR